MTAATVASVPSSHVCNGGGLRMSQTANSVTTDYTWDAAGALPVVLDDETLRYVYGLDLIAAIDATDDETYFSYDGLGSTTDLTDDTGAVLATYQYDVFGAARASTGSRTTSSSSRASSSIRSLASTSSALASWTRSLGASSRATRSTSHSGMPTRGTIPSCW